MLFPSFLMGGFECSTHVNRDRHRIDELALTQHDIQVAEDYRLLRQAGIRTVRDGVRWNLIDSHGRLDFSGALPFLEAAETEQTTVIWDLFHYGYPDDLDPFTDVFIRRFADYCYAFARLVRRCGGNTPFYTPVNEISYFAWAGGEVGAFAPHAIGRGTELKRQLARASIAGMQAILSADQRARFVHCEPLVRVVAPLDAAHLADEAEHFNRRCVHEAWDFLAGIEEPALGGQRRYLDIVGVNYYGYNQWEHLRPDNVLAEEDPRRMPFRTLLYELHARYRRPIVVAETSSHGEFRASWLRDTGIECLAAMEMGVDLHGLCIYPIVDMFDWHNATDPMPLSMGLWDLHRDRHGLLARIPHRPMVRELDRLQRRLRPSGNGPRPPAPPPRTGEGGLATR
jgi:beta-glucosidase/6-phospho-beta-glucosidase/beta-galactosidase